MNKKRGNMEKRSINGLEKFKNFNKHAERLGSIVAGFSLLVTILDIVLPIVAVQNNDPQRALPIFIGALVPAILLLLLCIPWVVFILLASIYSFKAKPKVNPVSTLVCTIVAMNLTPGGILCLLLETIYNLVFAITMIESGEMIPEAVEMIYIMTGVLGGIGGFTCIAGTVLGIVITNINKRKIDK